MRHLDGDPTNYRAKNLAWGTLEEARAERRGRPTKGRRAKAQRVSLEERGHLRWALAVGLCSQREAARKLGMALSTIQGIVQAGESPRRSPAAK